jgi:hypothetical protein
MAPTTPPLINPSLQTNGGDDSTAGALASDTSAEKKQGSRAPRGPKVLNNFGSVQACRNPACLAKINGSMVEAEAAGGSPRKKPYSPSPRKKPCGEETFLLCLNRAKAIAKHGWTEPIELEGDPDDRANGSRPKKGLPKTTKAPPVTQEDDGMDDLDSDEEEVDSKGDKGGNLDDDEEELDAACNKVTLESIPARPRGDKRNGSVNNRTNGVTRESIPARPRRAKRDGGADNRTGKTTCKSIPARPRWAKRDGGANNRTDGSRPKNSLPKRTGNLDKNNEELDNEDIEDDESLKDKGKTAPMLHARTPPHPQVSMALFGLMEVFGSTTGGKNPGENRTGQKRCQFFTRNSRGWEFQGGNWTGRKRCRFFPPGTSV